MSEDVVQLQEQINELQTTVDDLTSTVEELVRIMQTHTHSITDGTSYVSELNIKPEKDIKIGATYLDSFEVYSGGDLLTLNSVIVTGKENPDNTSNFPSSQLTVQHFLNSANQTFLFGFRPPLYSSAPGTTISITSGGTTVTDSNRAWTTDELAGAMIVIYDSSGNLSQVKQIASNTSTQITIDGTWNSTVSGGTYLVYVPMYLGSANIPWRWGYFGGDDISSGGTGAQRRVLRFGYGTSSGPDVVTMFFGTGSPESVVTANVGSIYLRTNGGAGTTLYVKESGTGNTGWIGK